MTFSGRSPNVRISELDICSDKDPDLVLAPSDYWKLKFQLRLANLMIELKEDGLQEMFTAPDLTAF